MNDIPLSVLFGALVLLLMLSAFFSGSETALMTLNRYRLRHLAEQGHKGAARAERLLARPDRLIGLILLGNNFVNILASSLATIIAIRLGGEAAIAIAAGLLTLVVLIFSEVAPKTLAALHPEKIAFPASFIYGPLLFLLYPLVWTVNGIANGLLKVLRMYPDDSQGDSLSQEELRTVVNEAGAMISQRHRRMLLSILDLDKATVEDIMVPRGEIDGIDLCESVDEIFEDIVRTPYSRVLVYENDIDHILGTIHARRVLRAVREGEVTHEKLRDMIIEPYFIPEGTPLNVQLGKFQRNKRQTGLVIDEYGDVLGLVTISDLVEEIVGEITTDPTDRIDDVRKQKDGSYLVDGSVGVRELVRRLQWNLPLDGPKTLNGLILEYMENIPEPGISLRLAGYPMEILQIQDNAVKTVRIWPKLWREE